MGELTPMMQQYMEIKEKNKDCILMYRLGDFYEMFFEDAKICSEELDLVLTGRDCGLEERVPMVGFPYHAADNYFKKIALHRKLVIVDDNDVTVYDTAPKQTVEKTIEMPQKEQIPPTVSQPSDDLADEVALSKFFDKDALCVLHELFDYNLDMQ